jgi:quaternary ammonium compound-resistance protein SugE
VLIAWLLLLGAGILEIVWPIALKRADGFTRPWPSVIGVVAMLVSFVILTYALRTLPVGSAYAIWAGIGVLGVAAVGILALGESASIQRLAFLTLTLVGIIGLRIAEGR